MRKTISIMVMTLLFLSSIIILGLVLAEGEQGIKLQKGKNYLEINQTLYVSELILSNPDIESVSYFDEFLNKSFGYVNTFGGVGSNFLIKQGQVYEISASKNTTLVDYQAP